MNFFSLQRSANTSQEETVGMAIDVVSFIHGGDIDIQIGGGGGIK